jgi:branched-chain amino acid transport system ATP-binding protein
MAQPALLSVQSLTARFGGVLALDRVTFELQRGSITGLIGPNGAGKTTLFNCLSRLHAPESGEILLEGQSLLRLASHQIAEVGIGRTFQNVALFPTLTVLQNVMVGAHTRTYGDLLSCALRLPWAVLPFGTLKRVEMARALAARPKLLLLDEPAGGLNHLELTALAQMIRDCRDQRNLSVLLVEHQMNLVMEISDRVVVLNFGRRIANGTPAEVRCDPEVVRAYLGSTHR